MVNICLKKMIVMKDIAAICHMKSGKLNQTKYGKWHTNSTMLSNTIMPPGIFNDRELLRFLCYCISSSNFVSKYNKNE